MAAPPESLKALLAGLIDYAGLYPPASLPLPAVVDRYQSYLGSSDGWILNRLVLPAGRLHEARIKTDWRIALLVEEEPGPLPPMVETLETKLPYRLSLPTYCEAPLDSIEGAFAKFRAGGLTPDAIPGTPSLAGFLAQASHRRMPFKATAGLHHPVRSMRPLTYEPGSPQATMHGFLNVFIGAAFVWHGLDGAASAEILEEREPQAFHFTEDELRWRGRSLTADQIREARTWFAHSFGSCSFEEPVNELRELGLLP